MAASLLDPVECGEGPRADPVIALLLCPLQRLPQPTRCVDAIKQRHAPAGNRRALLGRGASGNGTSTGGGVFAGRNNPVNKVGAMGRNGKASEADSAMRAITRWEETHNIIFSV